MDKRLRYVDFAKQLATSKTTPAGGSASAALGALAAALSEKICVLTSGKEQFAEVQDEIDVIAELLEAKRAQLLKLVDEDEEAANNLFEVFSIPNSDPRRMEKLQPALLAACEPQLKIMHSVADLVDLMYRMKGIGSKLAHTDAGVSAAFARAAIEGAWLNLLVNVSLLSDEEKATALRDEADGLYYTCTGRCERIVNSVAVQMREY